jgi:hypothetical protein
LKLHQVDGQSLDTTFDGAGVIHGDLTPHCTAMTIQAVLDALSAPQGGAERRAMAFRSAGWLHA